MSTTLKKEILQPKDKFELIQFIKKEIENNGNQCSLNHIETSLITDMSYLFSIQMGLNNFNGNISLWNISNVTDMHHMFYNSLFNQPIGDWNISNVKNISYIFFNSQFNKNISNWNTSNVTDMSGVFYNSKFNGDISKWNTSSVTDMSHMFFNSQFNQDISKWNTSHVTNMYYMFRDSQFNQDISLWNTSNVSTMSGMFKNSLFNQDISSWNTHNIQDMSFAFLNSKIIKIPKWDYFPINNVKNCFNNCSKLIETLPDWYQFNHITNTQDRQKNYDDYLKSKNFNNSISNNLKIKNKPVKKI